MNYNEDQNTLFVAKQIELEKNAVSSGIDKFHSSMASLEKVRKNSETTYGLDMLKFHVKSVSAEISEYCLVEQTKKAGVKSVAYQYLKDLDHDTVSYLTCKCILDSLTEKALLSTLAIRVGTKVEDDSRFDQFDKQSKAQAKIEGTKGGYFKATMTMIKNRKITDYSKKKATLKMAAEKAQKYGNILQDWNEWPKKHKLQVGVVLIDCFIKGTRTNGEEGTGLVERFTDTSTKGKTKLFITGTAKASDWIKGNTEIMQYMQPDFLPCLAEPLEWISPTDGGYYSKPMQARKPIVKTMNKKYLDAYTPESTPEVYKAINGLQRSAYEVSEFIFEQAVPEAAAPYGIGMPGTVQVPVPECPLPPLKTKEELGMTGAEYKVYRTEQKGTLTPEQKKQYSAWSEVKRVAEESEHSRISKQINVSKTIALASQFRFDEKIHFVYSADFRGRLYAAGTALSPQGTDLSKALLRFKDGVALGKNGFMHLCYAAAGNYGVDKVSLKERLEWVEENKEVLIRTRKNPAETRDFWGAADKPWQFLAIVEDLGQALELSPTERESFVSHAICFQDGTCNGLQHFSMMLRDEVGGKAVNLMDSELPADIYTQTSDLVQDMLKKSIKERTIFNGKEWVPATDQDMWFCKELLEFGIDRKCTKKPTMVIPYGGTKIGCRDQMAEWMQEKTAAKQLKDASYVNPFSGYVYKDADGVEYQNKGENYAYTLLHHYVWKALDETVVAARTAMKFIKDIESAIQKGNKTGTPVTWTTPTGFKVIQDYKDSKALRIKTKLDGSVTLFLRQELKTSDKFKMRSSISPNFVHSLDASHLIKTVNFMSDLGITDVCTVHDSFGTHAGNCDMLHMATRMTFTNMYKRNILLDFWNEQAKAHPEQVEFFPSVTDLQMGTLDTKAVVKSRHFFR